MLWQKFRGQITYLLVSLVLVLLILSIYDDVYALLKVSNKESLWVLMLVKYSLLVLIVSANVYHFKSIKVKQPLKKDSVKKEEKLEPIEQAIIDKPVLKNRTDFILEKYRSKKDV